MLIYIISFRDNSFTGAPAMPIPYEQHKKLKKRKDKVWFSEGRSLNSKD
jgi:hypothetical protein